MLNNKLAVNSTKSTGKSAFEIRENLLHLAYDICMARYEQSDKKELISVEKVVETAHQLNEFVSQRNGNH